MPVPEDRETFHSACIWMKVRYRVTLKCIFSLVVEWALSIPLVCFAFPSLFNNLLVRISAGLEGSLLLTPHPKSQLTWILCPLLSHKSRGGPGQYLLIYGKNTVLIFQVSFSTWACPFNLVLHICKHFWGLKAIVSTCGLFSVY